MKERVPVKIRGLAEEGVPLPLLSCACITFHLYKQRIPGKTKYRSMDGLLE